MAIGLKYRIHGINKMQERKEDLHMNEQDYIAFDALVIKVQQHEETITQLMEIVAATNRKLTELSRNQHNTDKNYSLS